MAMSVPSGGGRSRRSRRAPMAEINVTPFVDVMLVLLIIFMVTAPLLTSAVPVNLPDSAAAPLDQDPAQISVVIDEQGFIYLDDQLIEVGGFPQALESLAAGSGAEAPLVTLRADRALDYGRVIAVMGELNRAGFRSISLVTTGSQEAP
ncbi:MAG: ExbD/TolR family protein [Porphyrobacter sp.]|nr:ExbD/TolR family protein [Porphyrobacter sp.]